MLWEIKIDMNFPRKNIMFPEGRKYYSIGERGNLSNILP